MCDELGIEPWNIENLDVIANFETSFSQLTIRIALLGKLADVPEFPDEILPMMELYLQNRSSEISDALQTFVDSASVFLDRLNSLPEEEQTKREYLHEAIRGLSHIRENILPKNGFLQLPVKEMPEYGQTLQEALPIIVGVKMMWISDVFFGPQRRSEVF